MTDKETKAARALRGLEELDQLKGEFGDLFYIPEADPTILSEDESLSAEDFIHEVGDHEWNGFVFDDGSVLLDRNLHRSALPPNESVWDNLTVHESMERAVVYANANTPHTPDAGPPVSVPLTNLADLL